MKKKTLFAHDVPIIKSLSDNQYYSSTFSYELWQRYLKFSSELIVASRQLEKKQIDKQKYNLSSGLNVRFESLPNPYNFKQRIKNVKAAKSKLEVLIKAVDNVVVRLPSEIGLLAYEIARQQKKPVLIEMVGCPEDSYKFHGSLLGKIYSPLSKYKYKKVLKHAPYVLYVTKNYLQSKYPSEGKSSYASNVIINEPNQDAIKVRMKPIEGRVIKVGMIGSLDVEYKGFETALKALSLLEKKHKFEFEIVGGGNAGKWQKRSRELGIYNNVTYKGKLKSEQVIEWLDTIDIYIQPSKTEGLPRALVEAMSRGCPCIASNVGGIPELIREKYLHSPSDFERLYNILKLFIENKEERKEASQDNLRKAHNYSFEKLQKRRDFFYKDFFEEYGFKSKINR